MPGQLRFFGLNQKRLGFLRPRLASEIAGRGTKTRI
jgi:hypothetical protein